MLHAKSYLLLLSLLLSLPFLLLLLFFRLQPSAVVLVAIGFQRSRLLQLFLATLALLAGCPKDTLAIKSSFFWCLRAKINFSRCWFGSSGVLSFYEIIDRLALLCTLRFVLLLLRQEPTASQFFPIHFIVLSAIVPM